MSKFAFDPPEVDRTGKHHIRFHDEKTEGNVSIRPSSNKQSLKVVYVGAKPKQSNSDEDVPNLVGPRVVREVLYHIKKTYPEAKNLYGDRNSGARYSRMSDEEYSDAGGQSGTRVGTRLR